MYLPVSAWFATFLVTVLLEAPVVWLLVRRQERDLVRLGLLVVFANLATHPAVWFIFTQLFLVGTSAYVAASEAWAVVAECVFWWATIRGLTLRRAAAVALAADVTSFFVGRLVGELWPELFW